MKIKKGDKIVVLSGKDRGKTGTVLHVWPQIDRVTVEGINMLTKHQKPRSANEKGQKIQFPAKIHVSNVALVDPQSDKATRVGYRITETNGRRVKERVAKKSNSVIA